MRSNDELLAEKAVEIQEQVKAWATDNLEIPARHQIVVTVAVILQRLPQVPVIVKASITRKGALLSKQLNASDWDKILSLAISSHQRTIVEFFRGENNREATWEELQGLFTEDVNVHWAVHTLNNLIRQHRYRLRQSSRATPQKLQFIITT